jgi:hypothetical protein
MKNAIRILSMLLYCSVFTSAQAQLVLENVFNNEAVFRVNLEFDGEKYVTYLPDSQKIKIYNINHALWKEFNFVIPQNSEFEIHNVSQALLNSDSLIEVAYSYRFNTFSPFTAEIKSEMGSVLFTIDEIMSGYSYHQNQLERLSFVKVGNEMKMIANVYSSPDEGFHVYSLPQLQLEHIYKGLGLVQLEIGGTKYAEVTYDAITRDYTFNLYNTNHTLYKSSLINIEDNVPVNYQNVWHALHIIDISENKINTNPSIEISLSLDYSDTEIVPCNNLLMIYDENGILLNTPIHSGSSGTGSIIKNGNNYNLLCYTSNFIGFPGAPNPITVDRLELPSFQNLQSYSHTVSPIGLEGLGTKFYDFNYQTGVVNFYNIDYSVFKTFNLPLLANTTNPHIEIFKIGTTYFDDDSLIEILYNFRYLDNGNLSTIGYIYKEGIGNILDIPNCLYIRIDSTQSLQHKIIAAISSVGVNSYYGTNIYSWPGGVNRILGVKNNNGLKLANNSNFELMPNPVVEILNIKFKSIAHASKIEIIDILGNVLYTKKVIHIHEAVNVSWLAAGTYFVRTDDEIKKFIK